MNVSIAKSNKDLPLKGKKIAFKDQLQLTSMCAFPALLVFVFSYLPMVGIIIAFKKYKYSTGIFGSEWCGFDNFKFFFQSKDFLNITVNTLYMNFLFIITGTVASVLVAIFLYHITRRACVKTYQTILITPHFLSWVIVGYMVFALLSNEYGFINRILELFGKEPVDWYAEPDKWPAILAIVNIWKHVGMDSVIYYAALMGISSELFEAAAIDGAGKIKQTIYVTIPSIVPLIIMLTILKIGNIFRADFGLFYQVTRDVGTLYSTTDVMDTYIFRTMRVIGNMGMSSAAGLLQSVVGFVLVIITNTLSRKFSPDSALF